MKEYSTPTISGVGEVRPDSCTALAVIAAGAVAFVLAIISAGMIYSQATVATALTTVYSITVYQTVYLTSASKC
ncbi:hypothetical protein ACAG39_12450 [Caldicellulosiruptoraceae bacterium PP1]